MVMLLLISLVKVTLMENQKLKISFSKANSLSKLTVR